MTVSTPHVEAEHVPVAGPYRRMVKLFFANKLAVTGLIILALLLVFCFLGPLVHPTDQIHTQLADANLAPGTKGHPLGTDDVGRDVLGRLMIGGQTSLEIGIAAGLLATLIGTVWGAIAGYAGGWLDTVMMRVVDAGIAIPALFLLLVSATIFRPTVPVQIVIIGCVSWLVPARLVRAEALSLRSRDFVQAMKAMGGGHGRAVFRHIIPNAIGTVVVNATFQVADAILLIAYVSFLGLGVAPPATDWGAMLSKGISYTYDGYWWLIFPAGIAIVLVVSAFNCIGDGLRDSFEVRLQGR
ncbi:peptide ABC transporter permease [Microtetraspora sp. NBRC 13810]|uniref:ABC transporter permease n=1 Tax=Microtetraspora sp. NBRC 13810 TaxID=3030990 RepID=UPI00249FE652|nr:ABC transporter permease [Microtetraspora sp. NBRC 13810]GLW10459.1 peptide ABC transporter permease [Microtetraspora sp. NBRC 13810]